MPNVKNDTTMKNITSTFVILLISIAGFSQTTSCGMWYDNSETYHFASVNMTTGQIIFNNTLPSIQVIVSGTSVVDPLTNQYILKANYPPSRYITIDIPTGAIVNDTLAPDDIRMLKIHPTTGMVYGLWYDDSSTYHFASVNTLTGQKTVLDTLNDVSVIVSETAVLNPLTNQYIFKGNYPPSRYYTIDIATGVIVNDTLAPDDIRMLQIHPTTGMVYGLWYDDSSTYHFASVNTLTGQKTVLDTLNDVSVIVSETAVLNPLTNQYIFKGNYPPSRYYTIDIATGAIVNNTIAQDDIRMLELCSQQTSIIETETISNCKIYPNPFCQTAILQCDNLTNDNYSLTIYNTQGQLVRTITNISKDRVEIDRQDLTAGFYFFRLQSDRQIATGILIIE